MSETEREHIDSEAQNILRKCQDTLNSVKKNGKFDFSSNDFCLCLRLNEKHISCCF